MARTFRPRDKRGSATTSQSTRIERLEQHLFEVNSYIVRNINATPEAQRTQFDLDVLEACEEYRRFLTKGRE